MSGREVCLHEHHLARRRWLRVGLSAAFLPVLAACDRLDLNPPKPRALSFQGVDITGAEYARELSLPDTRGQQRSLDEFKGRLVFLFFGFTQCPDVCPTTMADLAEVRRRLGADGQRVQGLFVTLDPERDTAQVLGEYVQALDPTLIGLRGTLAQTQEAARHFKIFFQKVPSKDGTGYTLDHTAGAFVFDTAGQVRLFVRHGLGVPALEADLRALLAEAG